MAGRSGRDPEGSASLVLASSVVLLHPEEAVFEAMLAGWTAQQAARLLAVGTIAARVATVRRFAAFTGEYPWRWQPADVEEWTLELRRGSARAHSTLRNYQGTVAMFCDYLVDARYGWAQQCQDRFGTHPVQICHEWNTAAHVADYEGRPGVRPFTRDELQAFLDHADAQVDRAQRLGRKGWLAAFRDATLFKTIYAFGLRRREAAMLDVVDFHPNSAAPQFGDVGICSVRYGKAMRGSPPRRRSVLTVMDWSAQVLEEYLHEVRPGYGLDGGAGQRAMLWPTERGGRVSSDYINVRFREYRDAIGLPAELHPHCLRHAYVTHLIEDGFDPFFVQQQVGHAWGSTTALYTGVSSDYKNRALTAALGRALNRHTDPIADAGTLANPSGLSDAMSGAEPSGAGPRSGSADAGASSGARIGRAEHS